MSEGRKLRRSRNRIIAGVCGGIAEWLGWRGRSLDLAAVGELNFCEVDLDAYPCLRLAREAAVQGGTAPCTLNAANEVAVHAFLGGRLGFLDIPEVIERTLSDMGARPVSGFESLYEADRDARELAAEVAGALR